MSTVTFDTLKFVETLKNSGFDEEKAKGIAKAYKDAGEDKETITKNDLELALQKELNPIKIEQQIHKYMLGIVMGGVIALILKAFF